METSTRARKKGNLPVVNYFEVNGKEKLRGSKLVLSIFLIIFKWSLLVVRGFTFEV